MKKINRICIYPKDVQAITGRSLNFSRLLLREMRKELGKGKNDFITIEEFCRYKGISYEEVRKILNN
ncbi:hypothetical protein EIH07_10195 [Chryseobacterium taklimakanense]|uniref:hypothetical protein n=1 Tax=Chryseobacterium taklimakanense TaxID=536441 RepID=UPI000F5F47A9|nr:hypothetical protein [Chryseobacterium taklimakanense]AZI23380.1 hypothetical protein EIH07_10195 [Chryseobacterium taklimakanense]